MNIVSINPSNNQRIGDVIVANSDEVKQKVALARNACIDWANIGIEGRNLHLKSFFKLLAQNKEDFAHIAAQEMGMPLSQARDDVDFSLEYLHWYADNAQTYLNPEITHEDADSIDMVYREPYGVAAVIIPWNFPFSNFVWQCGQNLVAGNTIVCKPSEEVPLFTELMEKVVAKSSLPKGVLNFLIGDGEVGKLLVQQDIDLICFTGSTNVGEYLYQEAAKKFIPIVMELGGSAPGIVFADADFDVAASMIVANRFGNSGQICDGLKRLLVHTSAKDALIASLKKAMDAMVIGDALSDATTMGPLVAKRQVEVVAQQLDDALKHGAQIVYEKNIPNNLSGAYFAPTLLDNISPEMRLWREEVFGPVLPIMTFETEAEAIALANDTAYGLGGYVFTNNVELFNRVAAALKTGMVSHNDCNYVKPQNPFGGYKRSGLGREHGKYGFYDVTQVKVISRRKK
jgi:succinate-semialdehyde dehydrogenase/glutarate-semialdehyde dehydrogenase